MPLTAKCTALDYLIDVCIDLELRITPGNIGNCDDCFSVFGPSGECISIRLGPDRFSMLEQVLRGLRFDFNELPLLVKGDSKEIRLLTPRIAVARLLPTVYSFTFNRYGTVPGTDDIRARFSAEIFRSMAAEPSDLHISSAFLGLIESPVGPLLAEEVVEVCNLETRVKRFHVGSPLHRYRYVDKHSRAFGRAALHRWARFDEPLVCFDWRHPLYDENGQRLADEPLSDDYASVWLENVPKAKALARGAFRWLESRFRRVGLQLIDICFFIDRTGSVIYGEISPDCMRVRSHGLSDADALDKDHWRSGGEPDEVLARYKRLYDIVFGNNTVNCGGSNA